MSQESCEHLEPYLLALRQDGATVLSRYEGGWSNCLLDIKLSQGPAPEDARRRWQLPEHLELWTNSDTHYPVEHGLFCRICKISLSWPQAAR